MLKISIAQINPTVGDLAGNSALILEQIALAKKAQGDVVVFSELALCGYPPEDLLLKRHFIDNNLKAIASIAKKTRGIVAIIGFVDSDAKGKLYNAAAIIRDGIIESVYRKQELPNYGVFDEKRYFTPGNERGFVTIKGIKCGINICEDIWVDNAVYKQEALGKAKLLINISSSPYEIGKLILREDLLKRRAQETKCPIVYVNMVGGQDELVFDGASMVLDATGQIIARAGQFTEQLLTVNLSGAQQPIPPKIDKEEEIYTALVLATRDYVKKNGFSKIALGLSGGIDSALVAAIAVDALGVGNVVGISMPSKFNSKATQKDAKILAENLGIEFHEIPITDIYKAFLTTLKPFFAGTAVNIAEENIQARIRGNLLMAFSNKFGWLILTTGNKSEMSVGYCTLYGDMCGGYAVLKDVYKTMVYDLARWRNTVSPMIPKSIIFRAPSAELRANQTDEESLGAYNILDGVLANYVEAHKPLESIVHAKAPMAYVTKTALLVDRNEYKRRQAPPGVKITPRAFGKDWRLPITNKYRG